MKKQMNQPDDEPIQKVFRMPSEGVKTLQVVDFLDQPNPNVVAVKLEVAEGEELGRTLIHRVNLDETSKAFFMTRLFLKAIGEPYKGKFDVDTDMWIGKKLMVVIVHNLVAKKDENGNVLSSKTYANIHEFIIDEPTDVAPATPEAIKWED